MSSNSQANNTRKPMTDTSRAYRQELAARAFTDAPSARTDAPGTTEAASDTIESALRRYIEAGGGSGKADDPYTDEEMGLV